MAYIPKDAEWYIAELICEIKVDGDSRNVVHRNFVLISAASPEDAYTKALEFGNSAETSYDNPEGKQVSIRFRGLGDLNVVHERLEDGAELMYSEELDVSEDELTRQVRAKSDLTVFQSDVQAPKRPDFRSEEVVSEVEKIISEDQ